MSLFSIIEGIKAQIVDTERMLTLVGNHPIMSIGFIEKLKELKSQLQNLPKDYFEPKVRLLFSGGAVKGSRGIKSSFISKTVQPFQSLVKTQTALVRFGTVDTKAKPKKRANSDLYLTALPVGSFGVELSQLEKNDLFDEQEVAKAIRQTLLLISSAAESDEKFEVATLNAPKNILTNLKAFLKEVAKEDSIIKMESGNIGILITEKEVKAALERVDATESNENETFVTGVLRGILLDSGKFEIVDNEGKFISGFIGGELQEVEIITLNKEFLNKSCRIHLRLHTTTYRTGNEKITYELIGIEPA